MCTRNEWKFIKRLAKGGEFYGDEAIKARQYIMALPLIAGLILFIVVMGAMLLINGPGGTE